MKTIIKTLPNIKANDVIVCVFMLIIFIFISCEHEDEFNKNANIKDFDGNTYNTVNIGTQTWMKENLRVSHFNDGTEINYITDNSLWASTSAHAYCWYNNDSLKGSTYGFLYNYYTVNSFKLCPAGWHVPSKEDWTYLIDYLGGESAAAVALREKAVAHWEDFSGSTNSSGFTALPGGCRDGYGNFSAIRKIGHWWSSSEIGNYVWVEIINLNEIFGFESDYKKYGFSVRCIKDINNLPSVNTNAITNISFTSATFSGTIISQGGSKVTNCGVVWSSFQNPTITNNQGIMDFGSVTGYFSSNIINLSDSTTYYVKAFATNSFGTAYGNELTFTTIGIGLSITDIEGNSYATIWIGGQNWMQENLKTTHYNDGAPIQLVTEYTAWNNMTSGAYCYNGNNALNDSIYGALYNWYAVNTEKLCPTGWHVPSKAEWIQLSDYFGGYQVSGGKLKEAGTAHWQSPNTGATNSSGFTALPGGFRWNGDFIDPNRWGVWWTSSVSEYDTNNVIGVKMVNTDERFYDNGYSKDIGASVRCIRN